ncbi:MAG TPA: DNA circularization N-terminal domain-containing protein [Acetobacteraceae bacterium]|nr:DNA circularization N-terminal domain-containing protein [Acetobacteraceae bacterium]
MSQTLGELTQVIGTARAIDSSVLSWSDGSWFLQLQPGSWRGVGFVLDTAPMRAGRRVAIHEYPYRDTAWVEDLGKLPRRFQIQAFLVGDDVYQQRDAMLAACEQPGPGTLVHPTLGAIECVMLDFEIIDRRERGRMVELIFSFIVASGIQFPDVSVSTGDAISSAAGLLNAASKGDLGAFANALGIGGIPEAAKSVSGFTGMAVSAVNDAGRAFNAVRGLVGIYGRFAGGKRSTTLSAGATVQSVLAASTTGRTAVMGAASSVNDLATLL